MAGDIDDGFEVVSDANADRERALEVTTGLTGDLPEDSPAVTTRGCELTEGIYTIHGRIWSTIGNGDRLWFRIDQGERLRWSERGIDELLMAADETVAGAREHFPDNV